MNKIPDIGIIIGTNRPTRIGRGIAEWVQRNMQRDGSNLELIDLAEVDLPFLDEQEIPAHHHYTKDYTKQWSERISRYDGFVIVFPQYNWGYPAVLKNAMDYLFDEWAHKPVSLMCYGGHGGFQGLIAMKLVTQGLDMYNMATNPPINISNDMFDEQGQFVDIEAALARYRQPMQAVAEEFTDLLGGDTHA